MAQLNLPDKSEVIDRSRADFKQVAPESNPYEPRSLVNGILVANGGRVSELYDQLAIVCNNNFLKTADDESVLLRADERGIARNAATQSFGEMIFTGISGSAVAQGSQGQGPTGLIYETTESVTVQAQILSLNQITRSGSTVTAETLSPHGLGTGLNVAISGAVETEYNGSFSITVINATEFQYIIAGSPTTPATGTLQADFTMASAASKSLTTGLETNLASGSTLTTTTTITGVDSTILTDFAGIVGGEDIETIDELNIRVQFDIQNPSTPFNKSEIIKQSRLVAGVTRVFVYEPDDISKSETVTIATLVNDYAIVTFSSDHDLMTGMKVVISGVNEANFNGTFRVLESSTTEVVYKNSGITGSATGTILADFPIVQPGQVRVFFVRDNDVNIIPSGSEVQEVKDSILLIKPAHTDDIDVIVAAPIGKSTDFTFTSLVPNTPEIQAAVTTNLQTLFNTLDLGQTVTEIQYQTAIQTSFDAANAIGVESFTLSAPSGNITAEFNEILTLGVISF